MNNVSIQFQESGCLSLLSGSRKLTDAVKITYGPKGRYVVYENAQKQPVVTKDGAEVAQTIVLEDPFENAGVQLIKEAALKTAEKAGDGSTTTVILTHALLSRCMKYVLTGDNPLEIQQSLEFSLQKITDKLRQMSTPYEDFAMFENVATVATNGEARLGQLVAEAFVNAGDHGDVSYEEGNGLCDELTLVDGWQCNEGYLSPHFINDTTSQRVEFQSPLILLVNEKISNAYFLLPILEQCKNADKPLVIFADSVSDEVLQLLVTNQHKGVLKSVVIKAPGMGFERENYLSDLAVLTGAEIVSENTSLRLQDVTLQHLGEATSCKVSCSETVLVCQNIDREALNTRIAQLQQLVETALDHEQDLFKNRLAKLGGKTAIIRLSAFSEIEMQEKKARVDDAIHAVKAAKEEGVFAGGGMALFYARHVLDDVQEEHPTRQRGIRAMHDAMEQPIKQLLLNGGIEPSPILKQLNHQCYLGYDLNMGTYRNLLQAGIVDPIKVIRLALTHAVSVVNALLTTGVVITKEHERTNVVS